MASKGMVAVPLAPHVYIGTKRYHMHNFARWHPISKLRNLLGLGDTLALS